MSPCSFAGRVSGKGRWLLEEAQVLDVLIGPDRAACRKTSPREQDDRIPDDALARQLVPDDLDPVHDGRLALVQHPPQVDDRLPIGVRTPDDIGTERHVDETVVEIQRLHRPGRGFPLVLIEHGGTRLGLPQEAVDIPPGEWVVARDLVGGEPAVADDLERPDTPYLALVDPHQQPGLAVRLVHEQRVVHHLEVDVPMIAVELRQPLEDVSAEIVVVEFAGLVPHEPLRLALHFPDELVGRIAGIAFDVDPRDRDAAPFVDLERDADVGGVGVVHAQRPHPGEIVAQRPVDRVHIRDGMGQCGGIERPSFNQLRFGLELALRHPRGAAQGPVHQDVGRSRTVRG